MKFCWATIAVNNLDESVNFYTEIVGLKIERRFNAGDNTEIAFLSCGNETKIELICNKNAKTAYTENKVTLGFETESLEKITEHLKNKGIQSSEPFQPNPHIKFIYITDPNGVKIQFAENIA
ncbi:MAG: VOC family protein [Clostridiales bacterium]|jgi:lactoylglutathione lyase|nr:VOC family protein [Clostridiales bacterium]